jgi:hypothetical protein
VPKGRQATAPENPLISSDMPRTSRPQAAFYYNYSQTEAKGLLLSQAVWTVQPMEARLTLRAASPSHPESQHER